MLKKISLLPLSLFTCFSLSNFLAPVNASENDEEIVFESIEIDYDNSLTLVNFKERKATLYSTTTPVVGKVINTGARKTIGYVYCFTSGDNSGYKITGTDVQSKNVLAGYSVNTDLIVSQIVTDHASSAESPAKATYVGMVQVSGPGILQSEISFKIAHFYNIYGHWFWSNYVS